MFVRLSMVPLAFLGVGLYRAWIATFFRYEAYPGMTYPDYAIFEASIGVVCLACALLARRAAPLWSNRRALVVCGAAMTLGSVGLVMACFLPGALAGAEGAGLAGAGGSAGLAGISGTDSSAGLAGPAGAILGATKVACLVATGGGLGILILIWCEFYGALNPMRVAIYHGAAILFGEVFCWLFMGLDPAFIAVFSVVLPLASLGCAHRSIASLPHAERPHSGELVHGAVIPWKPIVLMAICTFAMQFATMPGAPIVAGNILGTMLACIFVILGALSTSRWFNFDTIYRVAFPLVCATSLLVTPLLGGHPQATAFFFDGGYTMMSMFIMIVLANITFRFGISATWLNGIERGIRYLVETLGWGAYALGAQTLSTQANQVVHIGVAVVVFVAFLVIVLSEKSLAAHWGIDLHEGAAEAQARAVGVELVDAASVGAGVNGAGSANVGASGDGGATEAQIPQAPVRSDPFAAGQLSMRVSDLSKARGLSDREEEILQLMARRTPMAQMEENLFVARGTIKAHTGRIYKKLGVHSREELYEMLGIEVEQGERA